MIGMLVRNENRGERFRIAAGTAEPLEGLFAGKARVNQKTSPLGRYQRGIAGARRREDRNLYDWVASLEPIIASKRMIVSGKFVA